MTRRWAAPVVLIATALAGLLIAVAWAPMQAPGRPGTPGRGMMGAQAPGGPGSGGAMMGSAGMMDVGSGRAMMSGYVLPGNGVRVNSLDAARQRALAFADRWGLRVGEVMQFDNGFYAELQTTNGRGATEVLVDAVGYVAVEFGPAMMWNTSYGMHAGVVTRAARVSAAEATDLAQRWLDSQRSGLAAGEPEQFPGYYTLHTVRDGQINGMLSVNAYSGAVWYHTWHGRFVSMSEG